MAKQTLEIKDFTGGLNCSRDSRDIELNEFAQLYNISSSQEGILKHGGGLVQNIFNLPHNNVNFQEGYGLFATSIDYSINLIDGEFENGFEEGTVLTYADSHSGSPFAGVPVIQLQANSTHQLNDSSHHDKNDYYNNMIIVITSGDGLGQTRRIVDYDGATNKAKLDAALVTDANSASTYKIFRWVGDGVNFGDSGTTDYIDKGGSNSFSNDDIDSHSTENNSNSYFLRTKVSSITDTQSKNLGFVTYIGNTSNAATDFSEDSLDIGSTTLNSGVEYTLSFYCKLKTRYYGYVSGTTYSERVPFVQIYSDSVTDGTNTGLYLFESDTGPKFMVGSDSSYQYSDNITKQYIVNGDFEAGTATGGEGGQAADGTYDPPTSWLAYDGWVANTNNAITYSYISDANSFGNDTSGSGGTLQMVTGSEYELKFSSGQNNGMEFSCYMYQEIELEDNQWYELFFAYSGASVFPGFAIVDVSNLTSTGVVSNDTDGTGSQENASDGAVTLTVNGENATNALLKYKDIYVTSFTDMTCDYNNDPTITCNASPNIRVGQGVSGTGIPGGATVSSINTGTQGIDVTSFELSASTTGGAVTNGTLTFTDSRGVFVGVCTAVNSTTEIVFTGGLHANIPEDAILYTANYIKEFNKDSAILSATGSTTNYRYIGQNSGIADDSSNQAEINDYPKPYKFFVPDNSGSPRTIKIKFAIFASGAQTIRLDAVSVKKSFPDLLSMSKKTGISNPYHTDSESWQMYQMKFKIPQEYNNATDWVIRLHGGTWGFQDGAEGSVNNHIVYFDSIKLKGSEEDNVIFLNDNTSNNSSIQIYSENNQSWLSSDLYWNGINMKPVYTYINGMLKISDANFNSGNTSKIFYHLKRNVLAGEEKIEGYNVRDSAISEPPNLIVSAGGDIGEVSQTFKALNYIEDYTYAGMHQWWDSGGTETNWPLDDLIDTGRIIHYDHIANGGHPSRILTEEDGSATELSNGPSTGVDVDGSTSDYAGALMQEARPFYFAWAGQDTTDNDMGGTMASYTTGSVARVEFEFTYDWQSAYRNDAEKYIGSHTHPPIFNVEIGKLTGTNIFSGGAPSTDNKKLLAQGDASICTMDENKKFAAFFEPGENGAPIDLNKEPNLGIYWENSQVWPFSTVNSFASGHAYYSSKKFKGVVTFNPGDIAITDNVLMKFEINYPSFGDSNPFTEMLCRYPNSNGFIYNDNDWDFARWERIKFHNIDVSFRATSWTAAGDGVTNTNINDTKVNLSFGNPTGATAFGWGERLFTLAVSSVNIFEEESTLSVNDEIIGGILSGSSSTNTSAITSGQSPDITVYVGDNIAKDKFRSKLKYYMKDTESNIWYLQFYIDLETNKIHSTTSNYFSYGVDDTVNKCYQYTIPREKILNYNEVDSYESQTLVSQDLNKNEIICDYKTSVVANSRLYVGNIRQDGIYYPDRMLKSPIGKYNILPKSNFIDVAINDGDEITALEYYKDKLLQFKKRKVFVINTSGDYEFLEETFDNIGVNAPYQVCKTPYGIAWANQSGLHLYDGSQIVNLIDGKIANQKENENITDNWWQVGSTSAGVKSNATNHTASVGYDPKQKDIIVKRGIKGGTSENAHSQVDGYIYNLVHKSWYMTHKVFNGISRNTYQTAMSNFANDSEGNLISYNYQAFDNSGDDIIYGINDIMKWKHAQAGDDLMCAQRGISSADTNEKLMYFTTADFTFGNIAAKKKIYKVYVTYQCDADSDVLVKYRTNGSGNFTGTFSDSSTNYAASTGFENTNSNWETAELIPSSSINNIYSFQLQFTDFANHANGSSSINFKINDISIIYREKRVK